tara:strand:- start:314 stop:1090 length:777 start_codon:yes stop_codon:yes gene_type:complete
MTYDFSQVKLHGEPLQEQPRDLFIPPHALEIYLEAFEGPLDVLLYLIKKQKLDLQDLPVLLITHQYLEYIEVLHTLNINLAGDYLVMAATLAHMKSCLLLPKEPLIEDEEADPRYQLIAQLQAYEALKQAAQSLHEQPRIERDCFVAQVDVQGVPKMKPAQIQLTDLIASMKHFIAQQKIDAAHEIEPEVISLETCIEHIITQLKYHKKRNFFQLIDANQGISGMIGCFLAVLQLNTSGQIKLLTTDHASQIYVSLMT